MFFASWSNYLTYCIFLPQVQTQLLSLLMHFPHVPVSNVCWRLLTFLSYYRQILIQVFKWFYESFTFFTIHHSPITLTLNFLWSETGSIFQKKKKIYIYIYIYKHTQSNTFNFFMTHSQSQKFIEKLFYFGTLGI